MPTKRFQLLNPWPREALEFTNAVERAGRKLFAARRGMSFAHDLTVSGWRVLRAIPQQSGVSVSAAGIARRLQLTRQTAHEVVHELGRDGWVVLRRHPADRRALTVALTPRAVQTLASLEAAMRALLLEVTRDMSRQSLATATADLRRMTERLRRCQSIVGRRVRRKRRASQGSPAEP